MKIIGISRVRNESLIIADTVRHMERFCDGLLFLDDVSTDDTVARIEEAGTKVLAIIKGTAWDPNRIAEETRHRKLLYALAREFEPTWIFYFDADERFEGDVRSFLASEEASRADGVRIPLFDAYLTPDHQAPYRAGEPLEALERMYGPERRDILMLWRNSPKFFYEGLDQREPVSAPDARVITGPIHCKHFGKGISVEQWEETCDYYAKHFPEPYASKWTARKGKALHVETDFGTPLYGWPEVKARAKRTHPPEPSPETPPQQPVPFLEEPLQRLREQMKRVPGLPASVRLARRLLARR